jgi:hypothetical protein
VCLGIFNLLAFFYLFFEYVSVATYPTASAGKVSSGEAAYIGALWSAMTAKLLAVLLVNVVFGALAFACARTLKRIPRMKSSAPSGARRLSEPPSRKTATGEDATARLGAFRMAPLPPENRSD